MLELAALYTFARVALTFFAYSFAGWVWEVAYSFAEHRRFVNRGFLYGPLLPIYGAGALLAIVVLHPFDNAGVQFLVGCASAAVLEYGTSWVMERLFHARWWDYSDKPLNLNGRICLVGILIFGTMMLAVVHLFQPALNLVIQLARPSVAIAVAGVLTCLFAVDLAFTVVRMRAFNEKLELLQARLSLFVFGAKVLVGDARSTAAEVAGGVRNRMSEAASGLADDARAGLAVVRDGVQDTREALTDARETLAESAQQARDTVTQNLAARLETLREKLDEHSFRELVDGLLHDLPAMLPRPTLFERRAGNDPYFRPTKNREAFEWFREKVLERRDAGERDDGQGER